VNYGCTGDELCRPLVVFCRLLPILIVEGHTQKLAGGSEEKTMNEEKSVEPKAADDAKKPSNVPLKEEELEQVNGGSRFGDDPTTPYPDPVF
jgi:hypothetical protein